MAQSTRTSFPVLKKTSKNKLFLSLALLAFCWLILLTQGLTIGDHDDVDHVLFASDVSWKTLATNIFRPWSESPYWHGQGSFPDHVIHERVFASFLLKLVLMITKAKPFLTFFLYKMLPFWATFLLLLVLVEKFVSSNILKISLAVFYLTIPIHYHHVLWISDPVTWVHFLILAQLVIYLKLSEQFSQSQPRHLYKLILLISILSWFGMKTKSPALIAPLIMSLCMLFHFKIWKKHPKPYFLFLSLLAIAMFQVIPIGHLKSDNGLLSHFEAHKIFSLLVMNQGSIYGAETKTAWFDLKPIFPASLFRCIGFFSLWATALSIFLFLKKRRAELQPETKLLLTISILWISIEILLSGVFLAESRYLSGTMIPITLLMSFFLGHGSKKKVWVYFCSACLFISILINVKHVLWLREETGDRYSQTYSMAETIYKDYFHVGAPQFHEVGSFYSLMYIPEGTPTPRLDHLIARSDIGLDAWRQSNLESEDDFAAKAKLGFLYEASFEVNKWKKTKAVAVGVIPAETGSLISGVRNLRMKSSPASLFVYKWIA